MIIGEALKRLINGTDINLTIGNNTVTKTINFHYGDQKELAKWIDDKKTNKYPLVWYVVSPYNDENGGYKNVKSSILIFQSTEVHWFNSKRTIKSYDEVIEPVWQKIKKLLQQNPYIDIVGDLNNKYRIKDEPSWGVEADSNNIRLGQSDFTNKTKSITIDIVDGRIIELNLRIKTNCI